MNNKECSIIVSSCGSYRDVWEVFFTLFFKYWPDCPFDIYLITDSIAYEDTRVKTIMIEKDMGWANNMKYAIKKIDTPYFIFFIEDYLMREKVDTNRIFELFEYFKKKDLDYLRLFPLPGPDNNFDKNMRVGEISISAPYRLSLMASMWKTDTFFDLLKENENAWQMELLGSERAREEKYKFWSVFKGDSAVNYFVTGIKKGMWLYDAVLFCKKEGIIIDKSKRGVETVSSFIIRKISYMPVFGRAFSFVVRQIRKIK